MKRITASKPRDKKTFECPQCGKRRMTRPLDHEVSLEKQTYKDKNGDDVALLVDICENCKVTNFRRHFEPSRRDIARTLKHIQQEADVPEGESLEELL